MTPNLLWEVVKDGKQPAVRPTAKGDGQEITFRAIVGKPNPVTVTKTYRLFKGQDAFEMELGFSSPSADQTLTYHLTGPHGMPIEGEWYTGTFREVSIGQINRSSTTVSTLTAADIVKAESKPETYQTLPLKFAGVENQYFVVFFEPDPLPKSNDDKWDAVTEPWVARKDPLETQKSDVSLRMTSRPIDVGPNRPVQHRYKVFGGAKDADRLRPYGAEMLAGYRKNSWFFIPGASSMAQYVIAPMLSHTYDLTANVSRFFGGQARKLWHRHHPPDRPGAPLPFPAGPQDGPLRPEDAAHRPLVEGSAGENIRTTRSA